MVVRLCLSALLAAPLAGCVFPYHYVMTPAVSGTVTDATNRRPVTGAEVILRFHSGLSHVETVSTTTDSAGRFVSPGRRMWGIYVVPQDMFLVNDSAEITASGFDRKELEFKWSMAGPAELALGDISLTRTDN